LLLPTLLTLYTRVFVPEYLATKQREAHTTTNNAEYRQAHNEAGAHFFQLFLVVRT